MKIGIKKNEPKVWLIRRWQVIVKEVIIKFVWFVVEMAEIVKKYLVIRIH